MPAAAPALAPAASTAVAAVLDTDTSALEEEAELCALASAAVTATSACSGVLGAVIKTYANKKTKTNQQPSTSTPSTKLGQWL